MKNVFFALSLIGLFMICSCQKDEINENTNGTLENDSSEIVVTPDTSGKSLVFGIQPGLYGQKNVNAFENVTYSYVGYPNALAQVPASKRRYRIHFQAKNPAKPEVEWDHQATFEVSSANTNVSFPNTFTRWRIIYTMYHKDLPHRAFSLRKRVRVHN